jgi:hypothetical protein
MRRANSLIAFLISLWFGQVGFAQDAPELAIYFQADPQDLGSIMHRAAKSGPKRAKKFGMTFRVATSEKDADYKVIGGRKYSFMSNRWYPEYVILDAKTGDVIASGGGGLFLSSWDGAVERILIWAVAQKAAALGLTRKDK